MDHLKKDYPGQGDLLVFVNFFLSQALPQTNQLLCLPFYISSRACVSFCYFVMYSLQ